MFQRLLLLLLLIFTGVAMLNITSRCPNSNCHHEGECLLEDDVQRCHCFELYATGNQCERTVDHCASEPCGNNTLCTNGVGQFICGPCLGEQCTNHEGGLFSKLHVLFNHYCNYGAEQNFLTTIEAMGTKEFSIQLILEDYLIDSYHADPKLHANQLRWNSSTDLKMLARQLGMHKAEELPYNSGYYLVSKARFWDVGTKKLTVMAYSHETLVRHSFALHVLQPLHLPCLPDIGFEHCANYANPMRLDIATYNIIEPIVRKRCLPNSPITFRWHFYDLLETSLVHNFGKTYAPMLKIRPYDLMFSYKSKAKGASIERLLTVEMREGRLHKVARCYISLLPKHVTAEIAGGERREINASEAFVLDGAKSCDHGLPPTVEQNMIYVWHCSSDNDLDNNYCRRNLSKENKLNVTASALRIGRNYNFTLITRSRTFSESSDLTFQMVTPVETCTLFVDIQCVQNCLDKRFVLDKFLHLKAVCRNCTSRRSLKYSWSVDGVAKGSAEDLVITPPDEFVLAVNLIVFSDNCHGRASMKLIRNYPPLGGSCSISPTHGVEYETKFLVKCENFRDDDRHNDTVLTYYYIADELTLKSSISSWAILYLPQADSVKVIICDYLYSCTEEPVAVSVSALQLQWDLKELNTFLSRFEIGDIVGAMLVASKFSRYPYSLVTFSYIYEHLQNFQPSTLIEIGKLSRIIKSLLATLRPFDNKKAATFTMFLKKLSTALHEVILDGEIHQLLLGPYKTLTTELLNVLKEFSTELKPMIRVHPKLEDMSHHDFDLMTLPRVENWLQAITELHACIHYIGLAATHIRGSTENPLLIELDELTMEMISLDNMQWLRSTILNEKFNITFVDSPFTHLQLVSLAKNPFWWCPYEQSLSTKILYLSFFGTYADPNTPVHLKQPVEFGLKMLSVENAFAALPEVRGIFSSAPNMPVYVIVVPRHALLTIKFSTVPVNLSVVLGHEVTPSEYKLRTSTLRVPANSTDFTVTVFNNQSQESKYFLALLPVDNFSLHIPFSFTTELRECLSWNFALDEPQWISDGCRPVLRNNSADELRCQCQHLSIFAGKVYPAVAESMYKSDHVLLKWVPTNWLMLLGYVMLIGLLLLLLFWAIKRRKNKENLITDVVGGEPRFETIVYVNTGGQWHAGTTANIVLNFKAIRGWQRHIIYQDPESPQLTPNSTCNLKLSFSCDRLIIPLLLTLSHSNDGRYPSWYCRSIVVDDLKNQRTHFFKVEQWISQVPVEILAANENDALQPKKNRFKSVLEGLHINWFQFQPLCGPWRYGEQSLSRFERSCVWVSELALTLLLVAGYFGRTTLQTYEAERVLYYSLEFEPIELLLLSLGCSLAGVMVRFVFIYLILKKNRTSSLSHVS